MGGTHGQVAESRRLHPPTRAALNEPILCISVPAPHPRVPAPPNRKSGVDECLKKDLTGTENLALPLARCCPQHPAGCDRKARSCAAPFAPQDATAPRNRASAQPHCAASGAGRASPLAPAAARAEHAPLPTRLPPAYNVLRRSRAPGGSSVSLRIAIAASPARPRAARATLPPECAPRPAQSVRRARRKVRAAPCESVRRSRRVATAANRAAHVVPPAAYCNHGGTSTRSAARAPRRPAPAEAACQATHACDAG